METDLVFTDSIDEYFYIEKNSRVWSLRNSTKRKT